MKLHFIGADHEVTGSCHVIEVGGEYVLLDYGMEQGKDVFENDPLPVEPSAIRAVLLSHAHIDHSGMLPKLYKDGFRGPIYATQATRELCDIMLRDSAHIQEAETEWANRKAARAGDDQITPKYTVKDAEETVKLFVPVPYGIDIRVTDNITAHFEDVGHLLGSASVHLSMTEDGVTKTLVFSGDLGNTDQPLIKDPGDLTRHHDYVIIESTYGDRLHEVVPDPLPPLVRIMQETFDKGGNVIVPCFAVGRTQEMLYLLREIVERKMVHVPDGFSVYVDSPLAVEATRIFEENIFGYYDDAAMALIRQGVQPIRFDGLKLSVTADDSKAINFDKKPKIILSASGMCNAGRIKHHLKHNLWRPECTILFAGYQAQGTLGRAILEGASEVTIFGESIQVAARIERIQDISGHADKDGLLRWLQSMPDKPDRVFIVHGDNDVAEIFKETLRTEFGYEAEAPYSGAEFDLAANEWIRLTLPRPIKRTEAYDGEKGVRRPKKKSIANPAYEQLLWALEQLTAVVTQSSGRAKNELQKFEKDIVKIVKKWGTR